MKKIKILFIVILMILGIALITPKSYGQDTDEILNYEVTVDPRMNDGSLDITYEITWKVLDSVTEGPLTWVQIGTPNSYFDTPTALTKNIRSINAYNGSYVKIIFDRSYNQGEELTFKYKIHQPYMYKLSLGNCKYSFTPAWFTDAKVDKIKVRWNKDQVKSSNKKYKEDNYLVWSKSNMKKGEKLTVNVKYKQSAFSALDKYKQQRKSNNNGYSTSIILYIVVFILVFAVSLCTGGGYYGHRGFYGGYGRGYYGGCVYSSCACVHSSCVSSCAHSSCACACAGSGRAGCSKKDFYGAKIDKKKLKKILES